MPLFVVSNVIMCTFTFADWCSRCVCLLISNLLWNATVECGLALWCCAVYTHIALCGEWSSLYKGETAGGAQVSVLLMKTADGKEWEKSERKSLCQCISILANAAVAFFLFIFPFMLMPLLLLWNLIKTDKADATLLTDFNNTQSDHTATMKVQTNGGKKAYNTKSVHDDNAERGKKVGIKLNYCGVAVCRCYKNHSTSQTVWTNTLMVHERATDKKSTRYRRVTTLLLTLFCGFCVCVFFLFANEFEWRNKRDEVNDRAKIIKANDSSNIYRQNSRHSFSHSTNNVRTHSSSSNGRRVIKKNKRHSGHHNVVLRSDWVASLACATNVCVCVWAITIRSILPVSFLWLRKLTPSAWSSLDNSSIMWCFLFVIIAVLQLKHEPRNRLPDVYVCVYTIKITVCHLSGKTNGTIKQRPAINIIDAISTLHTNMPIKLWRTCELFGIRLIFIRALCRDFTHSTCDPCEYNDNDDDDDDTIGQST